MSHITEIHRSAVPYPFPLTEHSISHLTFDHNPPIKGRGRGRRDVQPCELCDGKYICDFQMWIIMRGFTFGGWRCWRCWDAADNEVREHVFQAKLRRLNSIKPSTQPQSALLNLLVCSSAIIRSTVVHFCIDFSWRSWKLVRFSYPHGPATIFTSRIIHLAYEDAEDLATSGCPGEVFGSEQTESLHWLSVKYFATHNNHNLLQKQGYFKRMAHYV